ncbi:beta-glucosidase [Murinocardiopsis flavida]|uniref:Beta-glucosidase n=1 Tax=Murinocardiopsis flavida TaxID=645275 RepID=A0A2P8DQG5_9ACTN|nr:GH1 family beta-glucosidase [Murinocardiopsis flavida]PSK99448.1 beta-glucosidase [Murinocardiopsis flavida]
MTTPVQATRDVPEFPHGFEWGAATAAYQVEGASAARGRSIWDGFCAQPGRVKDGGSGEVACDFYHRYPEDVGLMARLGLSGFRFSLSWPRIQPGGTGAPDPAGLDFYDRLVDSLLGAGIAPLPTLYHFDLPQELEDAGGWLERDTAERFADYTRIALDRLGDRVPRWITLNEPFVHMAYGYAFGVHAPGRALLLDALPAAHHQLLAHARAAAVLRAGGAEALLANNCTPVVPASDSPDDVAAAAAYDNLHNRLFLDPVLLGRPPDLSAYGASVPEFPGEDLAAIEGSADGLGVNYYNPTLVAAPGPGDGLPFALPDYAAHVEGTPVTGFGWPVVPDGLPDLLARLRDRYGAALPPLRITENGCSYPDRPDAGGAFTDRERIAYLDGHLRALAAAIADGADVRGYYTWSLIDNFEWAEGYTQRFGLVHVDFATQRRTPRASFHWYRDWIRAAAR